MIGEIARMNRLGVQVNRDLFCEQFRDAYFGAQPDSAEMADDFATVRALLVPVQLRMQAVQKSMQEQAQKAAKQIADDNAAEGARFMAHLVKTSKDVVVTESGLAYRVIQKGKGPSPSEVAKVKVIYTGKFVDGKEFDSSKGKPVEFSVGGLIKGFTEGLKLMNKGAKYILYIPGNLAYGEQAPPEIGPNRTLIFEVELVDIIGQ